MATDAKGYPIAVAPKEWGSVEHTIKGWAVSLRIGWEWYGFKRYSDGVWDGFVHGFEDKFGTFDENELKENKIELVTDPKVLSTELAPPLGWTWKQKAGVAQAPAPIEGEVTPTAKPVGQVIVARPGATPQAPEKQYAANGVPTYDSWMAERPDLTKEEGPQFYKNYLDRLRQRNKLSAQDYAKAIATITKPQLPTPTAQPTPKPQQKAEVVPQTFLLDPYGKRLTLYHGTNKDFEDFNKPDWQDIGIHFGTLDQANARLVDEKRQEGARIIPVNLRVANTLELPDLFTWDDGKEVSDALLKTGKFTKAELDEVENKTAETGYMGGIVHPDWIPALRSLMQKKGYDSIKYLNRYESAQKMDYSYIVLSPEQIVPIGSAISPQPVKPLDPYDKFSDAIVRRIEDGEPIKNNPALNQFAAQFFGGSAGEGKYDFKNLYDAVELGINKYILSHFPNGEGLTPEKLDEIQDLFPTERERTLELRRLQQYSTPPSFAFVVADVANITPDDVVLEPSAGVGNIATQAKLHNPYRIIVNEIADLRNDLLSRLPFDRITNMNAEHIGLIGGALDNEFPTVVVMNPPFSASVTRGQDQLLAAKHISAALRALQPGGRLVAIVGKGMTFDSARFRDWFKKIMTENRLLCNIEVSGDLYMKKGTTFDNRIMVIDKLPPETTDLTEQFRTIPSARVETYNELLNTLQEIKNERIPSNGREAYGAGDAPELPKPATSGANAITQNRPQDVGKPVPSGPTVPATTPAVGRPATTSQGGGGGGKSIRPGVNPRPNIVARPENPTVEIGSAGGKDLDLEKLLREAPDPVDAVLEALNDWGNKIAEM